MYWEKDRGYLEAYRGLEAAFLLGLIGHIGLSNVNTHQIKKILDIAFIRPVILEVNSQQWFISSRLISLQMKLKYTC